MNQIKKTNGILGCAPRAIFWNFLLGGGVLILDVLSGGPRIYIDKTTALIVCLIFFLGYLLVTWWSVLTLTAKNSKENLVAGGPYRFVRHPMYGAIVWLLNPALAIFFRSWLMVLAVIPAYFIWRRAVRGEEKDLIGKFGPAYREYSRKIWLFFPNFWRINKPLFYGLLVLTVFLMIFVVVNSADLYPQWVTWEKSGQIQYDDPEQTPKKTDSPAGGFVIGENETATPKPANYSSLGNSVLIPKLNISAPLVQVSETSQDALNAALNQGVIIYPGSVMPGQIGEVYLSGHSSTYSWNKTVYGRVFATIDKLVPGDIISVVYNNLQYDYRVSGKQIFEASEVKTQDNVKAVIKLVTCWPIGTSQKRLVVEGELIR